MSILHVITSLDPKAGGVSQALRTIVKELSEIKVHNEVACIDAPGTDYIIQENFPVHALGPGKTPWRYNSKVLKWMKLNLKNYTEVIVHGLWQYQTYAVYKAWKDLEGTKPRLFVMPHGMLDPYFQRAHNRKFKAFRNMIYWKVIEKNIINNADGLLFTCIEECRLAKEPFRPYTPKKEIVVGLGVEEPPANKLEMRKAFADKCTQLQDHPYLLFLSRIHYKKGVDLLIHAYADLCDKVEAKEIRYSDNSIILIDKIPRLIIAGPNLESSFGQEMQKLVDHNPLLKEKIYFVGMLTGDAKWGAFYGCEAFILPSHQENFGIAVVEAMACSKPVLISNKVNIWKEIIDGGAGFVANNTLEGTRDLLVTWCTLAENQKGHLQNLAKQLYLQRFGTKQVAKYLIQALQ